MFVGCSDGNVLDKLCSILGTKLRLGVDDIM